MNELTQHEMTEISGGVFAEIGDGAAAIAAAGVENVANGTNDTWSAILGLSQMLVGSTLFYSSWLCEALF